ncbi:MAG: acetolactate synthase small subunit [Oscillospiraceae bacterium]
MKEQQVLTVMVKNHAGVLARVSSLFGQRGYNIESLTVSATDDPLISRMTVVVEGDEDTMRQVIQQTAKLQETIDVYLLPQGKSLYRELLLIKLEANDQTRSAIHEVCDIYGAQIIDLSVSTMVIELTGTPQKLDAFMEVIRRYPIVEICRTGATALERGLPKGYQLTLPGQTPTSND